LNEETIHFYENGRYNLLNPVLGKMHNVILDNKMGSTIDIYAMGDQQFAAAIQQIPNTPKLIGYYGYTYYGVRRAAVSAVSIENQAIRVLEGNSWIQINPQVGKIYQVYVLNPSNSTIDIYASGDQQFAAAIQQIPNTPKKDLNGQTFYGVRSANFSEISVTINQNMSDMGSGKDNGIDRFGIKKIFPDGGGRVEEEFEPEYKTRNYASGKPSEPSVEFTNEASPSIVNGEVTGFIKIDGMSHDDNVSIKCKGGKHSDDNNGMDGRCYIFEFPTQGGDEPTLQKEWPHPKNHDVNPPADFPIPFALTGQYLGIKCIYYNLPDGKSVNLEAWLNVDGLNSSGQPNSNIWRRWWSAVDNGNWYEDAIINPIGNRTTWRIDGIKGKVDLKCASVREIRV